MKKLVLMMLILFSGILVFGQKRLSFEQAFLGKGESLTRPLPGLTGWLDDRHYLERKGDKLLRIEAVSGRSRVLLDAGQHEQVKSAGFDPLFPAGHTTDWEKLIFSKEDSITVYDTRQRRINDFKAPGQVENPTLSPDGKKVAFTSQGNLFALDIERGLIKALTTDGSSTLLNGYASWVYYEEILGRGLRYRAFWWSPDSQRIVFMRFDQKEVPIFTLYDSRGDYGSLEQTHYPKPGYANPSVSLGIADVAGGDLEWIPFADNQDHYLAFPLWHEGADRVYFQWLNRGQDHLRIYVYTLKDKALSLVYEEKQKTWVDFFSARDLVVMPEGLLLLSSRDGWERLYLLEADGTEKTLTPGAWTVKAINHVDKRRGLVYFSAAGLEDTTETQLFRVDLQGRNLRKLSTAPGTHSATFSQNASFYYSQYSSLDSPFSLELYRSDGTLLRRLGESQLPALASYRLARIERLTVPTPDGWQLPAILYLPADLDESRKHPLILSVYGGPGSSSVRNAHRGFRHHYLAQEGIIVMVVDHRGSGHFGKEGQNSMHRNLGHWEMHDYLAAVNHLKKRPYIDDKKIGIEGGSYGGYVVALALTKEADHFQLGISHFPVTDWHLYDSVYSERYMDTPQENPEGYKKSSVFSYVENFRGILRLTHGTMDDNVHMQNTLQLIDLLLDNGNEVELMLYPGERHGYRGPKAAAFQRANVDFLFRHFLGRRLEE